MAKDKTRGSWLTLLITVTVLAGLVAGYFLVPAYRSFTDEAYRMLTSGDRQLISQWVRQFGFWGPLVIIVATIAQMFLLVVNVVLVLLVALLAYGPWWGSLLGIVSICIASTVGYVIGRALGARAIYKLIGERSEKKVEDFMGKYGYGAVVVARISPFLSNDAVSFVAGLLKLNYWKFMAATVGGIIPLVALMAWMSEDMERLKTSLVWISAVSIAAYVAYIVYDRQRDRRKNKPRA